MHQSGLPSPPPFWQTLWFRGSIFLSIALVLFAGYRKRISQIEAKRKALEERVQERSLAAEKLQDALNEVERLKNRLEAENVYLQGEIKIEHNFENIITQSEQLKSVLRDLEKVASTDATVLILGESGTGKELFARALHNISTRGERPLVKVDCSVLPANLIESELFGHEKGAFTGAMARKDGRFTLADGGSIFLDEIGELPLDLQSKLLRVLQDGEFESVGGTKTMQVDVRVIAATNRKLNEEVHNGNFREDLFYRLNVFPITIPPLRDRSDDIPLLISHFVNRYTRRTGKSVDNIPQHVLDSLCAYSWPGNVRELENIIERAVIVSPGNTLIVGDWLPRSDSTPNGRIPTLEEAERSHIIQALKQTGWRVSGEKGAAKLLGINPKTLDSRMRKLNIQRPR
jgi:transcriptional regulator with GAF, ATPase, and Fis domain